MSATAEELTEAGVNVRNNLSETADYLPKEPSDSGPEDPMGTPDMPKANSTSQAQGRYTFGSGARPLDGYTIKRAIGRGGFGEVYYATSDSGKEVALKLILRNLDVERRGVVQCMNLKCPNLLTIFDLKTNDAGDAFVVMEYVAGPSLASVLKQHPGGLPLAELRYWLKGLVEGVAYLHDHGIVHRDLKPANLFMEEGIVKIGDYGLAKLITPSQGTEHSESIGTCHYMAPEIGSGKYNKPIDVYAIGVILYEMLTGRVPFEGETVNEVLMKHLTARPDVSKLPEPYKAIVARALAKDPNHRPSRLYDLLPPEDAPRTPDVRIIGDAKAGRGAPAGHEAAPADDDDVLRIEAEEPVFYIGPDTRPPRMPGQWRQVVQARLRANWDALKRPGRYQPQPQPRVQRVASPPQNATPRAGVRQPLPLRLAAAAPARTAAPTPPVPPPAPPALPSGRVRIAELAGSMLWAAPLLALLAVPATAILGIDPSASPQQVAYLYGMALLGTWITLIPSKVLETRVVDGTMRRVIALAAGLVVGAIAIALAHSLQLRFGTSHQFFEQPKNLEVVYFSGLYALTAGWSSLTRRDRQSRFGFWPILVTTLCAALLIPVWPYERPDGIAIAALIATAVQLVSPWSEPASLYAQYVRATEK
ncbi:MAG TPA: serine/threonine-protein kinase, partial [Isosphaeraceae bacterium]|nr:serine/threonine-protein kinase [Isosphaeraceae bacterium]